jgi:predicted metal-dependent phosphotriesterase family hydrolase
MGKIRTVLGDIDSSKLGFTMAHEHVFMDIAGHGQPDIEWSLYRWDEQLQILRDYKAVGGNAIIDANPRSKDGRDAARLKVASEQSGVQIVACTGFVKEADHQANCQDIAHLSIEQLTDFFVKEITVGMDGTDIKAGWIKGASMYCHITPLQERALRAAARASMITGVPVHTHTEIGTWGLEQIEIVESEGLDLTRFGLAHLDRNPDFWYHKKIAERGCYIIYDGPGKAKYYPDSMRVDLLRRLVDAGFEKQIMLCNDMGKKSHHTVYGGGPGWTWIKQKFLPRLLDEGFSQETIDNFMIHNPARFYSLRD